MINKNYHSNNPCDLCMNNPKNNPNASGVCYCIFANNVVY